MKIKEGCTQSTDDFWYDLSLGGYLVPEDMLEDPDDAIRVRQAIETIMEFEEACDEQIEGFMESQVFYR